MMGAEKDEFLEVVTALVGSMHPSHVTKLASLIRNKGVNDGSVVPHDWTDILGSKERSRVLFDRWRSVDVTPDELAGMLIGASHAYHSARSEESIQLVWTGPPSELVATRKTEQVLLEVIASVCREIFLTSFVAYKVGAVVEALSQALRRGVGVSILLESSEFHGGGLSTDSIEAMRECLPEATIYYLKRKDGDFIGGKVHAKVVVADAKTCFISSANLTGYAMEKNMEARVLIRGGGIPERLHRHLEASVTTGVVSPASSNDT